METERLIEVSVRGAAGILALNRPKKANAYSQRMLQEMEDALERWATDPSIRAIVITSAENGWFCAGADLDEIKKRRALDGLDLKSRRVFDRIAHCPVPTIAAIDGPAIGGGLELALACDLCLASSRAKFGLPETSLGLLPAAGGTTRLVQAIGKGAAMQMILLGTQIDAQQALAWGLVQGTVEPEMLVEQTDAWVERISRMDKTALRLVKQAIAAGLADQPGMHLSRLAQVHLAALKTTD